MQDSPTTRADMERLLAFLPKFTASDFQAVIRWSGGQKDAKGVIQMPYPEYDPLVLAFVQAIAQSGWMNTNYDPATAGALWRDAKVIQSASIDQIRDMLTFFVRSERFSEGLWEEFIQSGKIHSLLERLTVLYEEAKL